MPVPGDGASIAVFNMTGPPPPPPTRTAPYNVVALPIRCGWGQTTVTTRRRRGPVDKVVFGFGHEADAAEIARATGTPERTSEAGHYEH